MERDDDVIDDRGARNRRARVRRYVGVAAGAVALLIVGAAGGVFWSERHRGARTRPTPASRDAQTPAASPGGRSMPGMSGMPAPSGQGAAAKTDDAVEVSLTAEAVERAGIKTAEVKAQSSVSGVTVPGLYYHFASKADLIREVYRSQGLGRPDEELDPPVARTLEARR